MERVRLNTNTFAPIIAKLVSKHCWASTILAGSTIQFVVPSLNDGDKYQGPETRFCHVDLRKQTNAHLTPIDGWMCRLKEIILASRFWRGM